MHPLLNEAIEMRRRGATYDEISTALGMKSGSLNYMFKDVVFTDSELGLVKERRRNSSARCINEYWASATQSEISNRARKAMVTKAKNLEYMEMLRERAKVIYVKGLLAYRKDELPAKAKLESLYGVTFVKEKIGRVFIDFTSSRLLIEHTSDFTKGIYDVIRRFVAVKDDPRLKIAYVDTLRIGPKRRAQLSELAVIGDYRSLL